MGLEVFRRELFPEIDPNDRSEQERRVPKMMKRYESGCDLRTGKPLSSEDRLSLRSELDGDLRESCANEPFGNLKADYE